MRTECLNSKYAYDTPLPVSRLVSAISDSILSLFKHQSFCTYQTLTNILSYIVSTIFGHLSLISTRRNFSRGQNFPFFKKSWDKEKISSARKILPSGNQALEMDRKAGTKLLFMSTRFSLSNVHSFVRNICVFLIIVIPLSFICHLVGLNIVNLWLIVYFLNTFLRMSP